MIVSSVESIEFLLKQSKYTNEMILKTLAIFYKCGIQATNNAIFSRLHHDYVQLTITKHKQKTSRAPELSIIKIQKEHNNEPVS